MAKMKSIMIFVHFLHIWLYTVSAQTTFRAASTRYSTIPNLMQSSNGVPRMSTAPNRQSTLPPSEGGRVSTIPGSVFPASSPMGTRNTRVTHPPTSKRPHTQPTSTPVYNDRPIQVTLRSNSNYDNTVGRNKAQWISNARTKLASEAGVPRSRIIDLDMTKVSGNIRIVFVIEKRKKANELATEQARDRLEDKVLGGNLRIDGPNGRITINRNSFTWGYDIEPPTTPKKTTPKKSTTTTTTTTTTEPPYIEQRIRVTFSSTRDYDSTVGRNKTEWIAKGRTYIATRARVDEERIAELDMIEGSVIITFIIEKRLESDDTTTDQAKDRLYNDVRYGRFRLSGPYGVLLIASRTSFAWEYVDDPTTQPTVQESKKEDDELALDQIYIILIALGGFIVIVLVIAIIVIACTTKRPKSLHDNEHYESANDQEIFITPTPSTKNGDSDTPASTEFHGNFDY